MITVIIPVYNGEKYLKRCLDSVKNQTYENWQAVIVDDGSADNSGKIADLYTREDPRFCVIHQKNQGQSPARLNGVAQAKGGIVMFLDCDDCWEKNCLERIKEVFCNHDTDIVMFSAVVVDEEEKERFLVGHGLGETGFVDIGTVRKNLLTSHDLNSMCLKAFKRELFDSEFVRDSVKSDIRFGEDKTMLLPLVAGAEKIYFLKDALYRYTHSVDSISHNLHPSKITAMISPEMFAQIRKYMEMWKMDDHETRRKVEAYYLRNLMSCYFKMKRHCKSKEERTQFRKYPWRTALGSNAGRYLVGKELSEKEKLKLLYMSLFA